MSSIWQRLRGQWFRILLVLLSLGLILAAFSVLFQPAPSVAKPAPLAVGANEYEIAWLYPATNTTTWERFVAAMRSAAGRLKEQDANIEFEVGDAAFPLQTTTVPEVAIRWRDSGKRLVIRWYKLTSSSKTSDWVEALARRAPPPLAVIGGGNSHTGLELARQMQRVGGTLADEARPLLLLTTATADDVPAQEDSDAETPRVQLNDLYPQRTFRFCFTNRLMAFATMRFLWQHDELRPEGDNTFQVAWQDDSYSGDLLTGYHDVRASLEAQATVRDTAVGLTGGVGAAVLPRRGGYLWGEHLRLGVKQYDIFSSVGTYHAPNSFEKDQVNYFLEDLRKLPRQRQLLIVAGQFQPTRRFLEALARAAPDVPQRLVVVAGDTISFNHIYRDRLAGWRTQDLPFPLVFFCHRNPIDPAAGFDPKAGRLTGTEDVLLFRDIVETVALAFGHVHAADLKAPALAEEMRGIRLLNGRFGYETEGFPLFDEHGKRNGGTGEHVVYLRPIRQEQRVLAIAAAEVWTRDAAPGQRPVWRLVGKLTVPDPQEDPERGAEP